MAKTKRSARRLQRDIVDAKILKAQYVEIPMAPQDPLPPEILRLRSDFLAGRELSPMDLKRIILASDEGGNGNCNIC